MIKSDGVWPWGECEHEIRGTARKWCGCGEWCLDPAVEAREMMNPDDAYWRLCRCCREPLYQLRIAELEGELAKFHKCDGDGWCTLDGYPLHFKDGERTRSSKTRTVYHKEDD